MKWCLRALICLAGSVTILAAVPAAAQTSPRPASERADRFVGTWILNPAESTFEGAPAQKSSMRTFDYERDGMILCTVHTVSEAGRPSFVHFLITLDGREYEELSRSSSAKSSPTYVSAKKIDEQRIDLTFKRDGQVYIWHTWTISDDGQTFTAKRKGTNAQGQPTYFVMVYDKQE
jgi:hypothetical protein